MNTSKAGRPGYFNTPSVLFSNAIVFALGGSLLQLGEHLLSDQYYPNAHLEMQQDLKHALVNYYDFLVAYQNLLRDGGIFNRPAIVVANRTCCVNHWPPQPGNIVLIGKETGNKQIVHLINFMDTESLDWHDPDSKRPEPLRQNNLTIVHSTNRTVKKIWFASPDVNYGSSTEISFTQRDTEVVFTIPSLKYWSMIVINY
jgi:dextranase